MKLKRFTAIVLSVAMSVAALTGCSVNKDAVVATYKDQEVKLGLINFMCRFQQAMTDDMYVAYMGEEYWNQQFSEEGTVLDSWKDMMVEQAHEMYALKEHMSEYGVEVTEAEAAEISEVTAAFMEANTQETLDEMGATTEIVEEFLTLSLIRVKVRDAITADVDTEVSDEEACMRAYTIVSIPTKEYYNQEAGAYISYLEEEKATLVQTAEAIDSFLEKGMPIEDAAAAVGVSATNGTYAADDEVLTPEVKKALDELKEGETAPMITTEDGYYFVRLDKEFDEEATATNKDSIVQTRKNDAYQKVLDTWMEGDSWTVNEEELDAIVIKNYFTTVSPDEE